MGDLSELGKMLFVGRELLLGDESSEALCAVVGVSLPTLRRYIRHLCQMGCSIVSVRSPSGWAYRIENPDQVRERLCLWFDLERTRSLV
jgi:hypothetical protein